MSTEMINRIFLIDTRLHLQRLYNVIKRAICNRKLSLKKSKMSSPRSDFLVLFKLPISLL